MNTMLFPEDVANVIQSFYLCNKGDEATTDLLLAVGAELLDVSTQWEPVRKELEFAINEMKKCIPTKPIREAWSPNTCPNCGADLGGECNDGYYQNPFFETCPECRQVLNYDF